MGRDFSRGAADSWSSTMHETAAQMPQPTDQLGRTDRDTGHSDMMPPLFRAVSKDSTSLHSCPTPNHSHQPSGMNRQRESILTRLSYAGTAKSSSKATVNRGSRSHLATARRWCAMTNAFLLYSTRTVSNRREDRPFARMLK